jgi:predicted nucleotidyltransferase
MSHKIREFGEMGLIHPPKFIYDNLCYLVYSGSVAYGVSSDTSDMDCYGICIPNKDMIFPHLRGEILGFGTQTQRFETWQQHHVFVEDELAGKGRNYDFSVYSIIKFFQLAMENNPNILSLLFVPHTCVLYSNSIGNLIRDNKKIFVHKGCFHKFKGYAYSRLHQISGKIESENPKRQSDIDTYGFDTKFAYHVVRLLLECEQLLTTGDMDLQLHSEQLKAIRRGAWTKQDIFDFFHEKEKSLEKIYTESDILPYSPNELEIKALLVKCLQRHFGNLDNAYVDLDKGLSVLQKIKCLIEEAGI